MTTAKNSHSGVVSSLKAHRPPSFVRFAVVRASAEQGGGGPLRSAAMRQCGCLLAFGRRFLHRRLVGLRKIEIGATRSRGFVCVRGCMRPALALRTLRARRRRARSAAGARLAFAIVATAP